MAQDALIVTLDGPDLSEGGVLADDLARVLTAVSKAMRLMVAHLGGRESNRGKPPDWVREQSRLKLAPTRPGSFVAELTLDTPRGSFVREAATFQVLSETPRRDRHYGEQALTALREWNGGEDSTLPPTVTDCLHDVASHLSKGTELWLGNHSRSRRVHVRPRSDPQASESATAYLHGWLKAVNWNRRTAQLHDYAGGYVRLRFRRALDDEMRRLATQYVEVRGQGELNERDKWTLVRVEEVLETRSHSEPFDLDAFLKTPNPKRFVPAKMVTASEPFDVDEFNRTIREAREA